MRLRGTWLRPSQTLKDVDVPPQSGPSVEAHGRAGAALDLDSIREHARASKRIFMSDGLLQRFTGAQSSSFDYRHSVGNGPIAIKYRN